MPIGPPSSRRNDHRGRKRVPGIDVLYVCSPSPTPNTPKSALETALESRSKSAESAVALPLPLSLPLPPSPPPPDWLHRPSFSVRSSIVYTLQLLALACTFHCQVYHLADPVWASMLNRALLRELLLFIPRLYLFPPPAALPVVFFLSPV